MHVTTRAQAVGGLALALLLGVLLQASAPQTTLPPCPTEDSPGPCRWDADRQGNGEGVSFSVLRDGRVIYDNHNQEG